jgi:phosphoserine phosphatase
MDVVIQGAHLAPDEVAALAALTEAKGVEPLHRADNEACRFYEVEATAGVAEACAAVALDAAFVAVPHRLADLRVVAMDMDSTLIGIECIDEIAAAAGIKPNVAAITARAMRGEIDFAQSLAERVALLEGVAVEVLDDVYAHRLTLSPGAERLVAALHAQGAKVALLSGGFTFFTERLRARLGLDYTLANTLDICDGRLTGRISGPLIDARAKADAVAALARDAHSQGGIALGIGDGANDVPMLEAADISVAWHAKPVARAAATFAIDHCGLDAVLNLFA